MIHYFGTEPTSTGHYFWQLDGNSIYKGRGVMEYNKCPFNPEALPYKAEQDGEAAFYKFAGFSIWAIQGSCKDKRPGSKSIFFVEGNISEVQLKELILATPIAKKMIEQMPFQVKW